MNSIKHQNIVIDIQDGIATITINRPTKLNALNKDTIKELHHAFMKGDKDKSVKVIIITGAGEKAFVAGADISEFADFSVSDNSKFESKIPGFWDNNTFVPKLVLLKINNGIFFLSHIRYIR